MTSTSLWHEPAVRLATSLCAVIVGLLACAAFRVDQAIALLTVAMVTVTCGVVLPLAYSLALSTVAWGIYTGFVINRYGDLSFTTADLRRLAVLVGCALASHWRR